GAGTGGGRTRTGRLRGGNRLRCSRACHETSLSPAAREDESSCRHEGKREKRIIAGERHAKEPPCRDVAAHNRMIEIERTGEKDCGTRAGRRSRKELPLYAGLIGADRPGHEYETQHENSDPQRALRTRSRRCPADDAYKCRCYMGPALPVAHFARRHVS